MFIFITFIIIIVLSIINAIYFILSHFFPCFSYYYDLCLCVACDVYVSSRIFFLFLVNDLNFILTLLIHIKNHFSFAITFYIIIVIITIILFFSKPPVIGVAWSSPTHWLLWVSRRVSIIVIIITINIIIIIIIIICKLYFGDHRWDVDAVFHIYHMTSLCHLRNSQITSSV